MAHVPPLLLRRDAQSKLPQIEGYTISPTVAAASSCLILSYVILGIAPSVYVFASTTNLCYMAAGFYREAVTATDRHSATLLVGQMAGGSLILVLMGASSFAFHRESAVYSPAHTLDILFGWLLVTHVFYVCFSVSLLAFVRFVLPDSLDERGARYMRTALSFSLLVAVTLLMTFYDTFYAHQTEFFFVLGPSAALFGGITRFILVYEDGSLRWHAVGLAVMEVVVALTVVFAAILSQGELLGRRLSRGTDPMGYDFFHGQWHFLLALVTSLLYSRAADAAGHAHRLRVHLAVSRLDCRRATVHVLTGGDHPQGSQRRDTHVHNHPGCHRVRVFGARHRHSGGVVQWNDGAGRPTDHPSQLAPRQWLRCVEGGCFSSHL